VAERLTVSASAVVVMAARGAVTAVRFLGHFLLVLFGVAVLGTGLDH
jgi:hypothetical protein